MSVYSVFQELSKNAGSINGLTAEELLWRMQTEGAELLGLGVANRPLLSLLPALGVTRITARDRRMPCGELLLAVREAGAELVTGEGYLQGLGKGVLFRTPSLRPDVGELVAARERGATVTSEMALFLALCPARLYLVTGSDGKTTTAMMTAAMLRASGRRVFLGGNIGEPLLDRVFQMTADDAAVLELSSFQLSDLTVPRAAAAITSITENHLDWHTDMHEYLAAKARILGDGRAVLNADYPALCALPVRGERILFSATQRPKGRAIFLEGEAVRRSDGGVLFLTEAVGRCGRHEVENAMAASGLVLDEVAPSDMERALSGFRAPPHRREYVGTYGGVECYDSSIDTTPARCATTLASFCGRVTVLLGGRGKHLSLLPLGKAVTAHAASAVATGECREEIVAAIRECDPGFWVEAVPEFEAAVRRAHAMAGGRGALLLSPACTSFDAFTDYRERGLAFRAICQKL